MTENKNKFDSVYNFARVQEIREADPLAPKLEMFEHTPIEDLKVIEENVSLTEILVLRQFKIIQELDNKLSNGRIKDKETEKIKLQYYKIYLDAVSTFMKLSKGSDLYYDKDTVMKFLNIGLDDL